MVWVLWDILIPLMASFALGTLLGWLVWSWRRRSQSAGASAATAEFAAVAENNNDANSEVSVAKTPELTSNDASDSTLKSEQDTAAFKKMENANVVLITERDKATQAFEDLQIETEEMREKITQLEASAEESAVEEPVVAASIVSNSTPLTAGLDVENKENQKLDLLQSDLQQLTETLERERKARRATELELLNIKNRHDKLSSDFASTVSAVEHKNQIGERDDEIVSLKEQLAEKEQLASQAQQDEDTLVEEVAVSINQEEVDPEAKDEAKDEPEAEINKVSVTDETSVSVETQATVVESEPDTSISVAAAAGIDFPELEAQVKSEEPVVQNKNVVKNNKPLKNGHIPIGWTVPEVKPSKKERDQLTDIKGVGPVMEKILHDCGIYHFHQVANLDKSGIDELQQQIPQFPGRIQRDKWVKQAKALQQKKSGESA